MNSNQTKLEKMIVRSSVVHNNKYGYLNSIYNGCMKPLLVTCPHHGDFPVTPNNHMNGRGCPECSGKKISVKLMDNTETFINKSIIKHGDRYDYSRVMYIDTNTRVIIICREHGEFQQTPNNHLKGHGCKICGLDRSHLRKYICSESP